MQKLTVEQILEIMGQPEKLRNVAILAHIDSGSSTLSDRLVLQAGLTCAPTEKLIRHVNIRSANVSLLHEREVDGKSQRVMVNLVEIPRSVDGVLSEAAGATMHMIDGAIVMADAVEGLGHANTLLRKALQDRIKPILMINKIDRLMLEMQVDPEQIYQKCVKIIEDTNTIIGTTQPEGVPDFQLAPERGTVIFGSAMLNWGFTIGQFAKIYAKKLGISEEALTGKLWGDHFFDPESKQWLTNNLSPSGKTLERAFCSHILSPVMKLLNALQAGKEEVYTQMLERVGVTLTPEEKKAPPNNRELMRRVFQKWIPVTDTVLDAVVAHLPSPKTAQAYRCKCLYDGPQDDVCAKSIRECNPKGPLMIYVSQTISSGEYELFYVFARVFSGVVEPGQKVFIMGRGYTPATKSNLFVAEVPGVVLMMNRVAEPAPCVPCGNICGLVGIETCLRRSCTLSNHESAWTIRGLRSPGIEPVIRVAVTAKKEKDLPRLLEGLKRLAKADPDISVFAEENGQHIIAGYSEEQLRNRIRDLTEQYIDRIEITVSEPMVAYKEIFTAKSSLICMSKGPNPRNRLYCIAEPLGPGLVAEIEAGRLGPKTEPKIRVRTLVDKFGWDPADAKKLWAFGPNNQGANVLVDQTKGDTHIAEVREHIESAFQWVTREGVMTGEEMRGMRFNIVDAVLVFDVQKHMDKVIIPATRRVCYAAELTATPRLQQPIYLVEIICIAEHLSAVYTCLSQRHADILGEEPTTWPGMSVVKAYLPVAESLGLSTHLRSASAGQAFVHFAVDHWETIEEDPLAPGSKAAVLAATIRRRKGLSEEVPALDKFLDKL